jgi:hypothetical protein
MLNLHLFGNGEFFCKLTFWLCAVQFQAQSLVSFFASTDLIKITSVIHWLLSCDGWLEENRFKEIVARDWGGLLMVLCGRYNILDIAAKYTNFLQKI